MENLRFTIAAGETKTFERGGRYLEIIDAAGPLSIILSDQNGGRADAAKDVLSGTYMGTAFAKFEVYSATAQTVELFITDTTGGTKRQPGVVRIIDGEREKVSGGTAFRMIAQTTTGAAGTAMLQAFNPAGSGRNVYINGVSIGSSAADNYSVFTTTTQNTNFAANSRSLDVTGADGVTTYRFDNSGQVMAGVRLITSGFLQASAERELRFTRPVLLRPGYGLTVQAATLATTLRATWDLEELAV
jgi:hypothetical protein